MMAGELESKGKKARIETSPPSYEDTRIMSIPGAYPLSQQPGPATSGKSYRENKERRSMLFSFCPNPSDLSLNQDWVAVQMVKCCDVPRLMREGFYWDGANVIREEGFVDGDFTYIDRRQDRKRWAGNRHYFLKDLQEPPRWISTIEVFALNWSTLYRFNLNQLSRENMRSLTAVNQSGDVIYRWKNGLPQLWFNAVYDDMPLKGWWPWPRKN
ncbi:hypothetical protein GQX73_g1304 [Xylaria multiplex]|uniref:Uncharacterized protein n=1 Tax=Xylaria multiplex TaxID=323545 RepID=A0A7C8NAD1_9PEZI|nr:hypothetical protein GQX73_g1304 [Xylaria multiplex]